MMGVLDTGLLKEHIELILFFGILAFLANWFAYSRGFYRLSFPAGKNSIALKFVQVLFVFIIYFGTAAIVSPLIIKAYVHILKIYTPSASPTQAALMGGMQLLSALLSLLFLFFYCKYQDRALIKKIWKDYSLPESKPVLYDIALGILTWAISFPLVAAIGQICDMLLYIFAGFQSYEQVAVRYLKNALASPSLLVVALFAILFAAPVMEELLFRGFLQNWLKKHLGAKAAILLASLFFASFHLSSSHGIGNISLGLSLFSFACFLGFIYERQGSLFASIALHMTFNGVNTVRILFTPE